MEAMALISRADDQFIELNKQERFDVIKAGSLSVTVARTLALVKRLEESAMDHRAPSQTRSMRAERVRQLRRECDRQHTAMVAYVVAHNAKPSQPAVEASRPVRHDMRMRADPRRPHVAADVPKQEMPDGDAVCVDSRRSRRVAVAAAVLTSAWAAAMVLHGVVIYRLITDDD